MRRINLLTVLLVTLMASGTVSAQGIYAERGFGFELGLLTGGDSPTSYGGGLGYAVNRLFEAGVGLERAEHSEEDVDWAYLYVTPRVRFYPVRQSQSVPVTAWIEAHYHFISLSGADAEGASADGYGVSVGATREFQAGTNLGIRPLLTVMVGSYHEEQSFDFGTGTEELWEYDSNPVYVTGAVFASAAMGPGTLYGGPVVVYVSEDDWTDTQFGFRVGMVVGK